MTAAPDRQQRSTNAVAVYLIILVSFQVFLITVAVDGFAVGHRGKVWTAAAVSVALAVCSALFARLLRADPR
jgi:hypothetical protein